jgi:hypothetical protein
VLSQLKALHDELRAAIAELDAQTAKSVPDQAGLPLARLKVVRTSGRRKALIDGTINPCLRDVSPADADRMQDLRRASCDLAVETSQHIARWTMPSIVADWDGYRGAAADIGRIMLRRIADESAILYPLLESRAA